jgi:hypothetical protein
VLSVFWDVVASEHLTFPLLGRFFGFGLKLHLLGEVWVHLLRSGMVQLSIMALMGWSWSFGFL